MAWHGEGFAAPAGCAVLASSPLFPVQAIRYGDRAYGLLFHLEADEHAIATLCRACPEDVARAGLTADQVMAGVRGRLDELQERARHVLTHLLTAPS